MNMSPNKNGKRKCKICGHAGKVSTDMAWNSITETHLRSVSDSQDCSKNSHEYGHCTVHLGPSY